MYVFFFFRKLLLLLLIIENETFDLAEFLAEILKYSLGLLAIA